MHLLANMYFAWTWDEASLVRQCIVFALVVLATVYNIIVVSHVFTHRPWFRSEVLNSMASALNSVNAGQSVMAYRLLHVCNHHRYNNDRQGPDGKTRDLSSTFRGGRNGRHESLLTYALWGALVSVGAQARALLRISHGWRVGKRENVLRGLVSPNTVRGACELRQIRLDRAAHAVGLAGLTFLSWRWTLTCLIPAVIVAFALVNVQNYFEHYSADPENRYANAVSHYGRLYNLLTFNDGFHQEHHVRPSAHWSELPGIRPELADAPGAAARVVSPVPAILGLADRSRRDPTR